MSQQLHFRSSYFFRAAAFFSFSQNSHFFAAAIFFQNSFYFRANIHFLSIRSSLWQLLFGTAFFPLFWIKISKKELLIQSRYFCTVSTFPEKLHFGKSYIFHKSNISHYLLFLDSCPFRAATLSKYGTFYSSYLFKRATFLQHTFSEELLFHCYASFPQPQFLFIRY